LSLVRTFIHKTFVAGHAGYIPLGMVSSRVMTNKTN
jgi:hypothetical protein